MRAAMERVYGSAMVAERQAYAGKTDQQIILETFADRAHDELLPLLEPFAATYLQELDARRAEFLAHGQVLDGVVAALDRLAALPVVQSLLTGNLLPVARFKLDLLGLAHYFDFDVGAFGSDHHIRANLAPIAAGRAAQRYGRPFTGQEVVVIGDTPNDIDCGRAAGARTVAVASGPFTAAELRAHGADVVLASLADTEAAIEAILG
jgi:phosphoglycolate phosphatase-like HAD superfamily hydrolase